MSAKEKGHILIIDIYPLAQKVERTDDDLVVSLVDGRIISVSLEWFPRLAKANAEQRTGYEILGDGEGIHWPEIDEDISVQGLLRGMHLDTAVQDLTLKDKAKSENQNLLWRQ